MQAGLDLLEPALARKGTRIRAKVAIGTVKGDLHDIGKNLVVVMLKGAGFEVEDLGVDCAVEKPPSRGSGLHNALYRCAVHYDDALHEDRRGPTSDRPGVRIVVGGAPVTGAARRSGQTGLERMPMKPFKSSNGCSNPHCSGSGRSWRGGKMTGLAIERLEDFIFGSAPSRSIAEPAC